MYYFQGLTTRIQRSVAMESVQENLGIDSDKQSVTLLIRRLKMTAPNNSNRGMVCFFSGETRVLEATNLTSTVPSSKADLSPRHHKTHTVEWF